MRKIYQKMYLKEKSPAKGVLGGSIHKVILRSCNSESRPLSTLRAGFTLIELLVVVLIIGILAAVALPQYQKAVERTRAVEAMTNLSALVTAENLYVMANGRATTDLTMLDIQLNGEMTQDGKVRLPHFTYDVRNLNTTRSVPFEAVATRNNQGSDIMAYYLYYGYNGRYNCVAMQEQAKTICSAVCGSSDFHPHELGYYCLIK